MSEEDDIKFESSEDEVELRKQASTDKRLREKLKAAESKAAEYLAGWQRAKADYLNLQKSETELRAGALKLGTERVLLDLINIADHFERAMGHQESWEQAPENWRLGIEYIYKELQNLFRDYNLEIINPLDEDFNPQEHHALGTVPAPKAETKGKVANVLQKGYKLGDKIIRPAQVKTYE